MNDYDYTLHCPDGHEVRGTAEMLSGTALIGSVWPTDDGWDFEHDGYTEVHWDTETTEQDEGEDVFICDNGDRHKRSQLKLMEV